MQPGQSENRMSEDRWVHTALSLLTEAMTTTASSWWSKDTVAVVTGANKGIGYEIVRALADEGMTVVLTARDQARGQAALDSLKAAGLKSLWFHQLDIVSSESVEKLATWLKEQFGGIDILVNNAAVLSGSAPGAAGTALNFENAKEILDANYYGVKKVTEGLMPLLRSSPSAARIVNVTSRGGLYGRLKKESLKQLFSDEDNYTTELADSLATKYLEDVKAGRSTEEGWFPEDFHGRMYCESKMFLNVYAVALAKSLAKSQAEDHQILLSSFCPGFTYTDMNKKSAADGMHIPPGFKLKTAAEGADTGVWLALLSKEELAAKAGKFYGEREEYAFGWKNPPL